MGYSPLPSPWGYPYTRLKGEPCAVLKAARTRRPCAAPAGTIGEIRDATALVAASDEWVAISQVNVAGHVLRAADILQTGARLED
jgi:hypothetical protein